MCVGTCTKRNDPVWRGSCLWTGDHGPYYTPIFVRRDRDYILHFPFYGPVPLSDAPNDS